MITPKKPKTVFYLGLVLVLTTMSLMIYTTYYEQDKPWLQSTGVRLCKEASVQTCDESEAYYPDQASGTPYDNMKRVAQIVLLVGTLMVLGGAADVFSQGAKIESDQKTTSLENIDRSKTR